MQVFCYAMTYAKYATSKSVATINLTINAKTQEYEVPTTVNNKEVYVRKTFTDGEITEMENTVVSNNTGENLKITENGLYINDQGSNGYWIYIKYVAEDGYSSTLLVDHVYYIRAELKIVSIEEGSYFAFGLYNSEHENGTVFGVKTGGINISESTNGEYILISYYSKLRKHSDYTHANGTVFTGDYPDTFQFGSCATCVQESYIKNVMMLDLTQMFGAGNEPPKSWCDENITIETAQLEWIVNLES